MGEQTKTYITCCSFISWNTDRNFPETPKLEIDEFRNAIIDGYVPEERQEPDFLLLQESQEKTIIHILSRVVSKDKIRFARSSAKAKQKKTASTSEALAAEEEKNVVGTASAAWNSYSSRFKVTDIVIGQLKGKVSPPRQLSWDPKDSKYDQLMASNRLVLLILEVNVGRDVGQKILIGSYHGPSSSAKVEDKKKLFRRLIDLAEKAANEFDCNGNYIIGSDSNFAKGDLDNAIKLLEDGVHARVHPPSSVVDKNEKDVVFWRFPSEAFKIDPTTTFDDIEELNECLEWTEDGIIHDKGFQALYNHRPVKISLQIDASLLTDERKKEFYELQNAIKDKKEEQLSMLKSSSNPVLKKKRERKRIQIKFQSTVQALCSKYKVPASIQTPTKGKKKAQSVTVNLNDKLRPSQQELVRQLETWCIGNANLLRTPDSEADDAAGTSTSAAAAASSEPQIAEE